MAWQTKYLQTKLPFTRKLVFVLIVSLAALTSCSQPSPLGKRVFLSKGNISFILPDSSLICSKPILWPGDYKLSNYGEAGGFYHNRDSSMIVSIYVKAYPDSEHRRMLWRIIADEKRQKDDLITKNRNLAVIERFVSDSSAHTVTMDYHMSKRLERGWRGQASYERYLTFYGAQRTIEFWFFGPNNAANRQAIAAACATIRVNPTYLQAGAKPYPSKEYRD